MKAILSRMIQTMPVRREDNPRLLNFARRMRKTSTDAEIRLWRILRSRALSGFKFRRQHPIAGYILDFYCMQEKLAVESDGGQHADPEAVEYDKERTRRLNDLGIRVVRFWDNDILKSSDACAGEILRHLEEGRPSPQPSPGGPGEGVRGRAFSPSVAAATEGRGEGH